MGRSRSERFTVAPQPNEKAVATEPLPHRALPARARESARGRTLAGPAALPQGDTRAAAPGGGRAQERSHHRAPQRQVEPTVCDFWIPVSGVHPCREAALVPHIGACPHPRGLVEAWPPTLMSDTPDSAAQRWRHGRKACGTRRSGWRVCSASPSRCGLASMNGGWWCSGALPCTTSRGTGTKRRRRGDGWSAPTNGGADRTRRGGDGRANGRVTTSTTAKCE